MFTEDQVAGPGGGKGGRWGGGYASSQAPAHNDRCVCHICLISFLIREQVLIAKPGVC